MIGMYKPRTRFSHHGVEGRISFLAALRIDGAMAQDLMNTFAVVFLPELYQYDMREVHSCLTVNAWNAS